MVMMKRRDLLKQLQRIAKDQGVKLKIREGGSHTVVKIGDQSTTVPRHKEISDRLAKIILKQAKGEENADNSQDLP